MSALLNLLYNQGRGRPLEGADIVKYLLRATFDALNQIFANGQPLDTPAEGMRNGQLTVVKVDGGLSIEGDKCAFTAQATPVWGELGFYSQAITKTLGRGLLATINLGDVSKFGYTIFNTVANAGAGDPNNRYFVRVGGGTAFLRVAFPTAGFIVTSIAVANSTDYQTAIVMGGYDNNAIPWYGGQPKSNYLYGGSFFAKGGALANWTKIWIASDDNTATLYAAFANLDAAGNLDNFRVPDKDLSDVLQPNNLSTFTDDNGTSLDAITPEVGGAWTEQTEQIEVQTNRAEGQGAGNGDNAYATVETGVSDMIVDGIARIGGAAGFSGFILRYSDASNLWKVLIAGADKVVIQELNADVNTERASTAVTIDANTDYDLRSIADGQNIDAFVDSGNKASYGSAVLNETATLHGMMLDDQTSGPGMMDNFAVYPRTSSTYDSVLDGV